MTIVHNYKLWCTTEGAYVTTWSEAEPTTCPNDPSGHTIDDTKTVVQETAGTSPTTSGGTPIVSFEGPKEDDERLIMVSSRIPVGLMPYYCGGGDDETLGRGEGARLNFRFTDAEEKTAEVQYLEPVWLTDGEAAWKPIDDWHIEDEFSFSIVMPATVVTPNGTMTGNCHVVDEQGNPGAPDATHYIVVPAAGNGTYDVDLDQAVPVPSEFSGGTGYWDADLRTGAVTPSANPGEADYHLLLVQIDWWLMKRLPMGSPRGLFEVESDRSQWISDRWKFKLVVKRATAGAVNAEAQAFLYVNRGDCT